MVLLSGVAGLLAGALSMGAGEFISVRSQRELLAATRPTQITLAAAPSLDIEHNELLLVYLARGMSREAAEHRVAERMGLLDCDCDPSLSLQPELPETRGPARSRRHCLGRGGVELLLLRLRRHRAHHPLPLGHDRNCGARGVRRTGGPRAAVHGRRRRTAVRHLARTRGLRQLAIGMGAAGVTYLLGMAFGAVVA